MRILSVALNPCRFALFIRVLVFLLHQPTVVHVIVILFNQSVCVCRSLMRS